MELAESDLLAGIADLSVLIDEIGRFDVSSMQNPRSANVISLEKRIDEVLKRTFASTEYHTHLSSASDLNYFDLAPWMSNENRLEQDRLSLEHSLRRSINLLRYAQSILREFLQATYQIARENELMSSNVPNAPPRRVFVVHGHDDGVREAVARFLERIKIQPIILHEQANRGLTIIEKIERHNDVTFAVVILTPDDEGRVKGGTLAPRVRQNVLLELGYFLGRLGRENVCALKRGDFEIPTDFAGVVWTPYDGEGWKLSLCKELTAAGISIDFNQAFA